ncbi:hypothetical protein BDK51DRAFT_46533, partial [Blyttiomyces helicus]
PPPALLPAHAAAQALTLTEVSAERFRLETRLSEVASSESTQARQTSALQSTLAQKDQELKLLALKHQNATEQLRRAEEELARHRSASTQKDGDLQRLQSNVSDLSRRLKSQVDMLLDRDREQVGSAAAAGGGGSSPGPVQKGLSRGTSYVAVGAGDRRSSMAASASVVPRMQAIDRTISGLDDLDMMPLPGARAWAPLGGGEAFAGEGVRVGESAMRGGGKGAGGY